MEYRRGRILSGQRPERMPPIGYERRHQPHPDHPDQRVGGGQFARSCVLSGTCGCTRDCYAVHPCGITGASHQTDAALVNEHVRTLPTVVQALKAHEIESRAECAAVVVSAIESCAMSA